MAVFTNAMGGGVSSDELTALLSDVLKGKTAVTSDSGDEAAAGTLELTGDAADSHVLAGKTYYNTNAKGKRTGTMANRGAVNQELAAGGSYNIPAGYHNGSGKVTAKNLASQTDANATAAQILSGYSAWAKGNKLAGTMPNRGNLNWSGNNTTYNVPAGYYGGGTLDSRPSYNLGYNAGVAAGKKGISGIRWTTLLTDTIVNGQNRDSVSATIPSNVGGNVIVLAASSVDDPNTPTPVSMTVNGATCQLFRPSNNGGAVIGIAPPGATIVFKGTHNRGPQHIIIAYGIPQ